MDGECAGKTKKTPTVRGNDHARGPNGKLKTSLSWPGPVNDMVAAPARTPTDLVAPRTLQPLSCAFLVINRPDWVARRAGKDEKINKMKKRMSADPAAARPRACSVSSAVLRRPARRLLHVPQFAADYGAILRCRCVSFLPCYDVASIVPDFRLSAAGPRGSGLLRRNRALAITVEESPVLLSCPSSSLFPKKACQKRQCQSDDLGALIPMEGEKMGDSRRFASALLSVSLSRRNESLPIS